MKKLTAFLLSLLMVISTAACSSGGDSSSSGSDTAENSGASETTEPADPIELTCWVNEEHTDIFEYGQRSKAGFRARIKIPARQLRRRGQIDPSVYVRI